MSAAKSNPLGGEMNLSTHARRRDFWLRVSAILLAAENELDLMQQVCEVAIDGHCDWCIIDRFDGDKLNRVAVLAADSKHKQWAVNLRDLTERPPLNARRLKQALLYPGMRGDPTRFLVGGKDPQAEALVRKLGIKSFLSVPITGSRGTYGVLTAVTRRRKFTAANLAGGKALGRRIGWAIENTRLREALKVSESRFRKLFDENVIGLFTSNSHGRLFEANDEYLRITGWTRKEIIQGKARWDTITLPEQVDYCREYAAQVALFGHCASYEKTYLRRDGTQVPVLLCFGILEESTRKFIGYAIDLTKQKQIEKELQEAVRSRDEFLSIASHELKTPLTSLLMQVHILKHTGLIHGTKVLTEPKFIEKLDSIQKQVGRLGALVESLLDVSRVRGDRMALLPARAELRALTSEILERFSEDARQAGVEFKFSARAPIEGVWDRLRVEQVISNLISNAIKYGRGRPVHVGLSANASTALIQVRDQGIGIEEKDRLRVFERFERAASSNYGGLGLGLYITHKIVARHGGRIWVESEPGRGSTFFVELPREQLGRLDHASSSLMACDAQ